MSNEYVREAVDIVRKAVDDLSAVSDEKTMAKYQKKAKIELRLQYLSFDDMNIYITESGRQQAIAVWQLRKVPKTKRCTKIKRIFAEAQASEQSNTWLVYREKLASEMLEDTTSKQSVPEAAFELFVWMLEKENEYIQRVIVELHDFKWKIDLPKKIQPKGAIVLFDCLSVSTVASFFENFDNQPEEIIISLNRYQSEARSYPLTDILRIPKVLNAAKKVLIGFDSISYDCKELEIEEKNEQEGHSEPTLPQTSSV